MCLHLPSIGCSSSSLAGDLGGDGGALNFKYTYPITHYDYVNHTLKKKKNAKTIILTATANDSNNN